MREESGVRQEIIAMVWERERGSSSPGDGKRVMDLGIVEEAESIELDEQLASGGEAECRRKVGRVRVGPWFLGWELSEIRGSCRLRGREGW